MSTQGQSEARAVDWSFPMNPSQLPPKSPGSFPSFGAGPVDSTTAGRTSVPSRVGNHKRTPSAGYLPQVRTFLASSVSKVCNFVAFFLRLNSSEGPP